MASNPKIAIGYDLGGQGCKTGVFEANSGELLSTATSKIIPSLSAQQVFDGICRTTEALVRSTGHSVSQIASACLATAGTLGPESAQEPSEIDHILISPNIPQLNGFSFRHAFNKQWPGVRFLMENDANAAGWADWFYGIGQEKEVNTLLGFTLGTGLGGYIIINGRMIRPAELGHVIVDYGEDALQCGCGCYGCTEAYVSKGGICRLAQRIMAKDPDTKLHTIPVDALDPLPIAELARAGDQGAQETYAQAGKYLGRLIWNIRRVCLPDAVVVSGNISRSFDLMLPSIEEYVRQDPLLEHFPVIRATGLGADKAGILGAGGLAIQAVRT